MRIPFLTRLLEIKEWQVEIEKDKLVQLKLIHEKIDRLGRKKYMGNWD